MKRKNRKKTVNGFAYPAPFAGAVVVAVLTALAYVWLGYCTESLGHDLKVQEHQQEDLRKRYTNEQCRWMEEKGPGRIIHALRRHQLVMTWPTSRQVVHLRLAAEQVQSLAQLDHDLLERTRLNGTAMND
jgi:hypothetical protein